MTINERIAKYRKQAGLSQEKAAERMDMKYRTYSQMEREGKITADRLIQLAEIFGIRVEMLLYDLEPDGTLNQPPPDIKTVTYVPTNRELSAMKAVHNLPKDIREKVFAYIEVIYKKY